MNDPAASAALDQLNEILGLDGGRLVIDASTPTSLSLSLDLSKSECPECVLPKDLMIAMLRANLADRGAGITDIDLFDPRQQDDWVPRGHR